MPAIVRNLNARALGRLNTVETFVVSDGHFNAINYHSSHLLTNHGATE